MNTYTNFGAQGNMPALTHVDRVIDRRARRISREIGITYEHALAVVSANINFKEASHD